MSDFVSFGVQGGPIALFDQHMTTLIISSFENFMVGSGTISNSLDRALACGILF